MELKEIMTTNIVSVKPDSTVTEAAKLMQIHNVGSVPVCTEDGKILGLVTDRDIVVRNIANEADPKTTPVQNIMTKELVSASPATRVDEAARLMAQHQIRRLPVIQNDKLVGMVAIGDLATRTQFSDEAGEVLSEVSTPSRPFNIM